MSQLFQLGPETTPGVGGTADQRFPTLNCVLKPTGGNWQEYRHAGGKEVGSVSTGDLYAMGGPRQAHVINFNEAVYVAASNMNLPTPSSGLWAFSINPDQPDTVATYVAQRGSSGAHQKYRNVQFTDFGLHFERAGACTMTYRALSRLGVLGTGALDSATGITESPVISTKVGLWLGDDYADLAADTGTRFDPYGFSLDWHLNNRFSPDFVLDDSVVSFAFTTEGEVDHGGSVTIGFDVTGTDLSGPITFADVVGSEKKFIRVKATNTDGNYLTLDLHITPNAVPDDDAQVGNIRAVTFPFRCVPDATDNRSAKLTIQSDVTAL